MCSALFSQEVRDTRKVNSATVDLTPVRQWFRDKQGERPMKHWKLLQITEVKEMVGSWQKCVVKNETGDSLELLIQHLPASIPKHFADIKQRRQQLELLNSSLARSSTAVAIADATTPTKVAGSAAFVDAVMAERYKVELAKLNVEQRRARVALLNKELTELSAKPQSEFAMFSGRKYGGTEIWDCGQPMK